MGASFKRNSGMTARLLAAAFAAVLFLVTLRNNPGAFTRPSPAGDFYGVVSHGVMVTLFGAVGLYVVVALAIGLRRFRREVGLVGFVFEPCALRDALTLRHLHTTGVDCTTDEEARSPWRRWWHHCTFYGFLLCFASTSVSAVYHSVFGWSAPYPYTSLPVVLGTVGGLGLLIGPAGLLALRRRRDPALSAERQHGLDESFIALLLVTSLTGLLLLVLRNQPVMAMLLVVHLGAVLALFVTLPYGKFVHGIYRTAALVKFGRES
jgi:citrate/tricarballylate utilization protein